MANCPYCNGIHNKRLIFESEKYEYRGKHYFASQNAYIDRNGNLTVSSSTHCNLDQSEVKINYCPMCGRKFNNEG